MSVTPSRPLVETETGAIPLQRRDRRTTNMLACATREDGSTVEVTVIDLSYDGCGIESSAALHAGELIDLEVYRQGTVRAVVRWAAGTRAGLVFADPTSAGDSAPAREHKPRLHQRVAVRADVTLRRPGKLSFKVHISDVSPDGCKAEFIEKPDVGELLWVKFDGIEALEAQVCWVVGTKVGLRFMRPIHPAVFDLLLQRLR